METGATGKKYYLPIDKLMSNENKIFLGEPKEEVELPKITQTVSKEERIRNIKIRCGVKDHKKKRKLR